MSMTDTIADMIVRIKNAGSAKHEFVLMQNSKFKDSICEVLKSEGYIKNYEIVDAKVGKDLKIELKYDKDNNHAIHEIKRYSTPGLRKYASSSTVPSVLGGLGTVILSTSSGVMSQKKAKKLKVGGEVVAIVW
jgi:small subunit ribosomal protein S8